jgi:hypothetical protein
MKSLRQWKNKAYHEASLPIIDIEDKRTGNELADNEVESGGKILGSPFKKKVESFKSKMTELPTPEANKEGLGELGMKKVGDSTFGKDRLEAGRTPVISQGVPVKEEVLEEMALPRPIQFMIDRVLSMLGGNPMRAMALQNYIGEKLQGVLQGAGNSWARKGAMAQKVAGTDALKGVGQPEMAGAMEAVGTPTRPMTPQDAMGGPPMPEAEPTMEPGQETPPIPGPLDDMGDMEEPVDDAPVMDEPIDPQMDSGWGRDVADDLRHSGGDMKLRKERARIAMSMQHLSATQLDRVKNLLKMMKVQGFDEGE